jgi:hypothetical protein
MTRVNSLALVDSGDGISLISHIFSLTFLGNNYFFDNSTGLLFVKLLAKNSRIGNEYCGERGSERG